MNNHPLTQEHPSMTGGPSPCQGGPGSTPSRQPSDAGPDGWPSSPAGGDEQSATAGDGWNSQSLYEDGGPVFADARPSPTITGATSVVRFEPRGAALQLFLAKDPEVCIEGPAGTGKSRAALEKLHLCALKYPRARVLILRKTRVSLRQSALVTWERHVQPQRNGVVFHRESGEYRYPNGSVVAIGGLDKSSKVMSTEWDLVYVQEATEVTENDVQDVTTRLRAGNMPYQQLLLDCNPDRETHFLHRRSREGGPARPLYSRHVDNPALFNGGAWTPAGQAYMARLQSLSGVRRARLYEGRWASAEGAVYNRWDPAIHVVETRKPPYSWTRYMSVDFGYSNPFVAQFWAVDPDDVAVLYRELYMTQSLVEDQAAEILRLWRYDSKPVAIVCDHDAEGRATLEKHLNVKTKAAYKGIRDGVQAVSSRLRPRSNGRPGLTFMRGALHQLDPNLSDPEVGKSRPTCTLDEIEGYVWDTSAGRKSGEEPVDRDNHGMDAMRYFVCHLDGVKKEQVSERAGVWFA